ncbi:uncharacterized protein H6S33_008419 [Morchella sextelata]|uniref:uncharacterized protein n=1 Tax=Morchella sextelata TaxID=1174677 RepID=UPI001D042334|nr:uncharacterized protein H6S33_008419 [Morchella sextelata]KAH0602769.1 hypothetical protein H6S33_008419 [Morchella sextelata]
MSAVAIPPQQQAPHTASLNTPGFFTQAFLELNVFEQCFSSLQSSDSTPSSSTPSSTSTSEQKVSTSTASLEPPSPRTVIHQKDKTEYTTPVEPDLSLPSPIMEPHVYTVDNRRYSVQECSEIHDSQYFADRRFSMPDTHALTWTMNPEYDNQQAHLRPDNFYLPAQPTPPISVHSNSPMNRYNTPLKSTGGISTPPRMRQTPEGPLSPLDGMIGHPDGGLFRPLPGQTTPPADNDFGGNIEPIDNDYGGNIELDSQEISETSMPPETFECPSSPLQARPSIRKRGIGKPTIAATRKATTTAKLGPDGKPIPPVEDDKRRKKFLERNRVAASKCRQKKKLWMQKLEENARNAQLSAKNLREQVTALKDEMLNLKGMLLKHTGCGCPQIQTYLENEAAKVAQAAQTSLDTMNSTTEGPATTFTEASSSMLGENDNILDDGFEFGSGSFSGSFRSSSSGSL